MQHLTYDHVAKQHLSEPNGLFFILNSEKNSLNNSVHFKFWMKFAQDLLYGRNLHFFLHSSAAREFVSIEVTCAILRHKVTFQGYLLLAVRVGFDDDILLFVLNLYF